MRNYIKLYPSTSIIRIMPVIRYEGHIARIGAKTNAHRILVGKPEGKRPLGRPRRKWVGNIILDLREMGVGWCGLD
jgi:hypothetical protein